MKIALLAILLAGCVTMTEPEPEPPLRIKLRFTCIGNNLFAEFLIRDGIFVSLVGWCLGDMQIIGRGPQVDA